MTISHQSWLIVEKSFRLSSSIISTFLIARILGVDKFGLYAYVIGVITLILPIANMGLDSVLLREFAQKPDQVSKLMKTGILLKCFGAFFAIFALVIILILFQVDKNTFLTCLATSVVYFFGIFNVTEQYFQAQQKGKYLAIATINIFTLSLILKYFVLMRYQSVNYIIVIFVLEILAYNIVLGIMYYSKYGAKNPSVIVHTDIKLLFISSWPLLFSGFCIAAYMRVDQLMIENILDLKQLGIYSVAVKISESWYFLPAVIATAAAPSIYSAKKQDPNAYRIAIEHLIRRLFWLSAGIGIFIYMFAHEIVYYMAGEQYIESVSVLRVHIFAGIFLAIGVAAGKWFIAENYARGALYKALLGLLVNVGCNYVLIPRNGIIGAAYGTVGAHFFANIVYDLLDPKSRPLIKLKMKALANFTLS